jgi:hypothetical protein
MDVAHLLSGEEDTGTVAKLSNYVADDVQAYVNDKLVADGKVAWAQYYRSAPRTRGRVLAWSAGLDLGGFTLIIVDEYDTIDRSNLSPAIVIDSRTATRSALYEFGPDKRIHAIRTLLGAGFWITNQP